MKRKFKFDDYENCLGANKLEKKIDKLEKMKLM